MNQTDFAGRIMIALDYSDVGEARTLLRQLEGIGCYMKVGMQLFYAAGPLFVRELKERGYRVFLDLKMHDIPNTVKGGACSITRLGVEMFNVHAGGGVAMMRAAADGVREALESDSALTRPMIIGVTQLTSTNQQTLNDEIGIPGPVEEAVVRYAQLAHQAGLDGVVASPHEVEAIKSACGPSFYTVTPGIRPAGSEIGDQSRIMTPREAFQRGTDYIVIGRPVTAVSDPRQAVESILEELI